MAFTFDTKKEEYFNTATDPYVTAYTCGIGTKLLILGIVMGTTTPRAGGTPTYDGVAMTQIGSVQVGSSKLNTEMWYLVNPSTGSAKNFSIPKTGTRYGHLYISSYISNSTPLLDVINQSNINAQNPSLTVVTTENGEVIIDTIGHGNSVVESGSNQTLLYRFDDGIYNSAAQYALQVNAGSITFTHNNSASAAVGFIVAAFKESLNTKIKTILSDTKIKSINNQQNIISDALIAPFRKTILSDTKIKAEDLQETILSDSKIVDLYQKTILSDTKIKAIGIQKTILSNAKVVIQVLYDIINKINFIKGVLSDINNKINTVKRVLSDISNFVNTCKSIITDVTNDFRTKKLTLNNVTNDIRFMYNWQKAADGTIQSLGKSYIKVYIGGIEQTDVDVDSISISKDLSTAHNATFDLGRAYDGTKPTMEATVSIKYNDWILFAGYITQIAPAEDPEKIRIICQDEYWKQNKTNVYYHVGHRPTDNKELYYNTLASALTTEHGWTPGPGNFVPETIDNFAIGKSDAISNLIKEIGNYEWFYEVNGSKKLWVAGEGSIINLERQALGENINLYDVISHSFEESVEDIVNKFRVQMGEKVIRKFDSTGGSRTYTGYNYSAFQGFLTPAWNSSYEKLAVDSADGYGWDYPEPGYEKEYGEVFKKYYISYLDPKLSSWSDRYPPRIEPNTPSGYFYSAIDDITEGFTIDYENKILTFNSPQFLWTPNQYGEVISVRAPILKLFLWKKNYYTYTLDPTDDPETDISNPLMFFTDKMGSYVDTIIKDLNFSNLSIQEGGTRTLPDGAIELIPSWNDTVFAKDKANWELSKNCDIKIRGNIIITLDAICFYNIDLTKRIFIDGITDEPMNIISINYNISNFTVNITLENSRYYNRTVSFETHGE